MDGGTDGPQSPFGIFNSQANKRTYQQLRSQIENDHAYIVELERLLRSNGIDIPDSIVPNPVSQHTRRPSTLPPDRLMQDGSLRSVEKSLESIKDHNRVHEIYVQYRNLTLWNMVPERKISTVGSAIGNLFVGSGPKRRIEIIKDLSGRILPKTMTLLMGPPGCGKQ